MAIYLGVDIGTTSAKCLAVDENGAVLAQSQQPYPIMHPAQGWAEQDPEDYWRALSATVRGCVSKCKELGRDASEIASIAMSTQGDTLIVTDESGKPLTSAISWMDTRGEVECAELLSEADQSFWYRESGALLSVIGSVCSIRWLEKNKPDIISNKPHYCFVPDFLAKRLVGEFVIDISSASWTPLCSPCSRAWSNAVLELLGISRSDVSETMESGEVIGEIKPDIASELGLASGVKLIAGAFDQAAAAYGVGASVGGRGVLSCGTAWVLYSVSSMPPFDASECLSICCHVKPSEWGLVLPFSGGSTYDWLNRMFTQTNTAPSGSKLPIFIPHLYGGLSPDWRSESRGSLVGLTMSHTQEDIRLALMRGIACEARRNMEAAELLCGRVESVRMVGGAGKSDIWPQMVSNILNRPVELPDCVESACYGAAKLAAGEVSSGWSGFDNVRLFSPVEGNVSDEQQNYDRYMRFYRTLLWIYASE
ncbi:MAG: FGGY family carbohydrate kinase [Armatimonadota bacterium]|nr:hypothetical protein [bacterium]